MSELFHKDRHQHYDEFTLGRNPANGCGLRIETTTVQDLSYESYRTMPRRPNASRRRAAPWIQLRRIPPGLVLGKAMGDKAQFMERKTARMREDISKTATLVPRSLVATVSTWCRG